MSILSENTRNELLANLQQMFEDNQLQIESLQRTNNRITNLFINLISARGGGGAAQAEENYNGATRSSTARRNATTNSVLPPLPATINSTIPNTTLQTLWTSNANVNALLRSFYERDSRSEIPSASEIANSTETVSFLSLQNPLNTTCPITLENFNSDSNVTRIRTCGHIFNQAALERWFRSSAHCPMCRIDIRDPLASNQQNDTTDTDTQQQTQPQPSAERPEPTAVVAAQLTEMAMNLLNPHSNTTNTVAQTSISNIHHNPEDDSIYFDIESDELVNALSRIASDSLNRMMSDNRNRN
jgi:hypothetical protein